MFRLSLLLLVLSASQVAAESCKISDGGALCVADCGPGLNPVCKRGSAGAPPSCSCDGQAGIPNSSAFSKPVLIAGTIITTNPTEQLNATLAGLRDYLLDKPCREEHWQECPAPVTRECPQPAACPRPERCYTRKQTVCSEVKGKLSIVDAVHRTNNNRQRQRTKLASAAAR
jgi:hypothetical protein